MKTFPDGANYRIEISGIETPDILKAVIDEAREQEIPIHRAIAAVNGSMYWSNIELRELAEIAAKNKIEIIICPGDLARGLIENPNNIFTMMNWQSDKEIKIYLKEVFRCVKIGFRGFLVWRKGMLRMLNDFRNKRRIIPAETIFKLSTFDNNANVPDILLAGEAGADTINVANNLSLESLMEIRRHSSTVIDVHITFWQMTLKKNGKGRLELTAKPYNRIKDAPELARICSPCYFKFEAGKPGIGVYDLFWPDWTEKDLAAHKRKDVRTAAQVIKNIKKKCPEITLSGWGPKDLRIPVPLPKAMATEGG